MMICKTSIDVISLGWGPNFSLTQYMMMISWFLNVAHLLLKSFNPGMEGNLRQQPIAVYKVPHPNVAVIKQGNTLSGSTCLACYQLVLLHTCPSLLLPFTFPTTHTGGDASSRFNMAPTLTLLDLDLSKEVVFNVSALNDQDLALNNELAFNVSAFAEKANTLLLETSVSTARDGGDCQFKKSESFHELKKCCRLRTQVQELRPRHLLLPPHARLPPQVGQPSHLCS